MSVPTTPAVPEKLAKLVKYIMRAFYVPEQVILVDYLMRNPCIKEDDMLQLLHFERKQLRIFLASLKNDRFLKQKLRVETIEGKAVKHNYYFIDYHSFLNVVKYKMLMMQRRIDSQARDNSNRAKFVCCGCGRAYNELDVGQLYDPLINEMKCVICNQLVEEDDSVDTQQDIGLSVRFHEDLKRIFDLLDAAEKEGLPNIISEPQFNDITTLISKINSQSQVGSDTIGGDMHDPGALWSGDRHRPYYNLYPEESGVKVVIEGLVNPDDDQEHVVRREVPLWMRVSTVDGTSFNKDGAENARGANNGRKPATSRVFKLPPPQEIEQMLIGNEHKLIPKSNTLHHHSTPTVNHVKVAVSLPASTLVHDISEKIFLSVANKRVSLADLNDNAIKFMTDKERLEFVRLSHQVFLSLND